VFTTNWLPDASLAVPVAMTTGEAFKIGEIGGRYRASSRFGVAILPPGYSDQSVVFVDSGEGAGDGVAAGGEIGR
jgi:hypothetical protein